MDPLLEQAEAIVAGDEPPEDQLRALLRAWMAHVEAHRDHMLVFQQEWHFVTGRGGRRSSARARGAQALRGDPRRPARRGPSRAPDPQLLLMAVLGMVNYTPQWFDPRGRLTAEQIADGYCDLLLGGSVSRP